MSLSWSIIVSTDPEHPEQYASLRCDNAMPKGWRFFRGLFDSQIEAQEALWSELESWDALPMRDRHRPVRLSNDDERALEGQCLPPCEI